MAGAYLVKIDWQGTGTHTRVQSFGADAITSHLPTKDIAAKLSLCCPATTGVDPASLLRTQAPTIYAGKLKLQRLLNLDVVQHLRRHGTCLASSNLNGPSPPSLACILSSTGMLTIVCDKDTFETIGLEAAHSYQGRYYIRVDLPNLLADSPANTVPKEATSAAHSEGDNGRLRRVRWCFQHTLSDTFDVHVTSPPSEPSATAPLSLAALQPLLTDLQPLDPQFSSHVTTTTRGDMCSAVGAALDVRSSSLLAPFNVVGALALDVCPGGTADEVASSFDPVAPSIATEVATHALAGTLPASILASLVPTCWAHVHTTEELPWCAITLHGFEHSPYSFKQKPRLAIESGDNMLSILISKGNPTLLLCVTGNRDEYH